ncbi:ABC transporter substrate-binding protein [Kineococcus arenarius]|uniref:ABC transporter substrate-binding protein n=1 Tax=unclassified Kineococcus TaxID=2621656 RepID=UPI003D7E9525
MTPTAGLPRRRLLSIACLLAAAPPGLAACSTRDASAGGAANSSGATSASSTTAPPTAWVTPRELPAGWGSGEDDGVFPRTVVHAGGSTTISTEPVRVAVISTGQMDAALTLGVVPVGSTAGDGADTVPAYLLTEFADRAAQLAEVVELGDRSEPNLEALAAVAPDLILMNSTAEDVTELYGTMSAIAPTVVTRGTGLYWKQDFQLLADALGRRQQAQQWLTDHHDRAAELGAGLSAAPTVSLLRKNGDRVRVFGVASFSGSVVEDAGLLRPQAQSFTDETSRDISAEELDLVEGDWLFHATQGGDESEFTSMPLWPTLDVVRTGHAVEVDDDVFYLNTGPTAARSILEQLEGTLSA